MNTPICQNVTDEICGFDWQHIAPKELIDVAWSFYFFSTQFRECLELAGSMFPDDEKLRELDQGERNTDNLSPWVGVAAAGEKMNHDEFMRRTLQLSAVDADRRERLEAIGASYLTKVRSVDDMTKVLSVASYEDGGVELIFKSMLTAPDWGDPLLQAFKHFITRHIALDSDSGSEHGHGELCRHFAPDDRVAPLWLALRDSIVAAAPGLAHGRVTRSALN